ncbi:hypothetical protein [Kutzneria buriramensis]|uniref:Uncharacterized protein n=1 Tax=Kutzneria buriramensis TaxID=1045776 RepID=A0A3E0HLN7_9PSEU|nr:hypothetical protein [Kutzneria buriramensis]REH47317.1 hypothetical protein BCF44_106482 [Kutzneria buriramensis]
MVTTLASIALDPAAVTFATHLLHTVWMNLPAITASLRAVGAALSVATGVRALVRDQHHDRG